MAIGSLTFVVFALLSVLVLDGVRPGVARDLAVAAANLMFLASFVATPIEAVPLLSFVALGYFAVCVASRQGGQKAVGLIVVAVVASFIWIKQYTIVAALPRLQFAYATIGLSYVLFRVIHLIVDVGQGAMRRPRPLDYLNYTLFFLTLVSGPIQSFQDFHEMQRNPRPLASADLDAAIRRIVRGFVLLLVLAPLLSAAATDWQVRLYGGLSGERWPHASVAFAAAAAIYAGYLFVNFSGYMDIVIGVARLIGHALPENFNRPGSSANLLDLWSRWHMTLSEWFKIYLFNPLTTSLARRWGAAVSMATLGALAYFTTFCTMGVWHGSTPIFLLYGVMLGAGVAGNRLWQMAAQRRLGRSGYRALCQRSWYQDLSRASALAYFSVALSCLWIDPAKSENLLRPAGVASLVAALALLTFVLMALCGAERVALPMLERHRSRVAGLLPRFESPVWTAGFVFTATVAVAFAVGQSGTSGGIVYQGY